MHINSRVIQSSCQSTSRYRGLVKAVNAILLLILLAALQTGCSESAQNNQAEPSAVDETPSTPVDKPPEPKPEPPPLAGDDAAELVEAPWAQNRGETAESVAPATEDTVQVEPTGVAQANQHIPVPDQVEALPSEIAQRSIPEPIPVPIEAEAVPSRQAATAAPQAEEQAQTEELKQGSSGSTNEIEPTEQPSNEVPEREFGNILFNPPTEMTVEEPEHIEVRISREQVIDESGLIGEGEIIRDRVRVSNLMSVSLHGDKFRIENITEEKQILEKTGYTQWSFVVTPLKPAKDQILTLKVTIHVAYGNEMAMKSKLVYSKPITIDVDRKSEVRKFFAENWQWFLGLIIICLILWFAITRLGHLKKSYKRTGDEAIFVSYRRDDSSGYTLAIYEQLKKAFGDGHVFMDLDDIPHGEDFVEHIEKVLSKADTLVVMIGQNWLDASNDQGRRLDDPNDFVRLEVSKALQRKIRVIPVLLKKAEMPQVNELPKELHKLTRRNAIRIHDDQFESSVQRLIEAIAA